MEQESSAEPRALMSELAPISASPIDAASCVLGELAGACSALRLYGPEHPAFRQRAAAVVGSLPGPIEVAVSPAGFAVGDSPIANPDVFPLSKRLRSLGLVGLSLQPGLTAAHVESLMQALDEVERSHAAGQEVCDRIAAATDQHVQALPLRLGGLRLISGTEQGDSVDDPGQLWRRLFAQACRGGTEAPDVQSLARSLESSLPDAASAAQWNSIAAAWTQELRGAGAAGEHEPVARAENAAVFLRALSPELCRRLLTETIANHPASDHAVIALAERLPAEIVLNALSRVDRTTREPSSAALAMLRKICSQVSGGQAAATVAPRTHAELAEIASALKSLLETKQEGQFVPAEYLQRRGDLSAHPLGPQQTGQVLSYPPDEQTSTHSAALVFQIVSSADASVAHLAAGLNFLERRTRNWIRAGQFALATQTLSIARAQSRHGDQTVRDAAQSLLKTPCEVADLIEGSRRCADGTPIADRITELLRQADESVLARVLGSPELARHDTSTDLVRAAAARALPARGDGCIRTLLEASGGKLPVTLLTLMKDLPETEAMEVVQAVVGYAPAIARRAVLEAVFDRNLRWPLDMTERLLRDDEPAIRRLAMMRMVRDADLPTAADFLRRAAQTDEFRLDVAFGLGELLRQQRRHPDVRAAFRQWFWSTRRWTAFLVPRFGSGRRAA